MTDYRDSKGRRRRESELQTGFIGDNGPDASAELTNIDPSVPIDKEDGLRLAVRLRHGYEYVSGDSANHCDPDNADAINVGGFIAGAGAAAGTAAAMGATPIPGARVAGLATLAAGGLGSVGEGALAEMTGGFQFSIRVKARKKDGGEWYQLGHALPCVPTAGIVGDAKRDVAFSVYSPPEEGKWDVKVIMETMKGDKLDEVTKEVEAKEGAKSSDGESGGGFNLAEWAVENPAKAAGGGLITLVTTRAIIDNTLGGE